MSSQTPVNQVWIGNIPYEASEEVLREVMSSAGNVISIRIRYDKESGQSKGFAFCEYEDPSSCILAVKHLNGTLFGGRTLRVDFCSNEQIKPTYVSMDDATKRYQHASSTVNEIFDVQGQKQDEDISDEISVRVEVCRIVESLTIAQLFYLLRHIQHLIIECPEFSRKLLRENSALCYALIHALFICGMITETPSELMPVDAVLLERICENEQKRQLQLQQASIIHERNTERLRQLENQMLSNEPQYNASFEQNFTPSAYKHHQEQKIQTTTHSEQFTPYISEPSSSQLLPGVLDEILKHPELFQQIASLTPEQEAKLTEEERAEINILRQAVQRAAAL